MRKVLTVLAVGAMSGAAMLATAAGPADNAPSTRAYFNYQFGGARNLPSNFHYGLRLDRDSTLAYAPVMQFDLSDRGTLDARLNGLSLLRRNLVAKQDEAASGADTAAAGGGTAYTAADWGLIVLGAAGVAYAGYEVSKSDETPSTAGSNSGGSTTGSSTGGSTGGGNTTGGSTTGGSTTGGLPLLSMAELDRHGAQAERMSREYSEWLDGGSGQMGDLAAR